MLRAEGFWASELGVGILGLGHLVCCEVEGLGAWSAGFAV